MTHQHHGLPVSTHPPSPNDTTAYLSHLTSHYLPACILPSSDKPILHLPRMTVALLAKAFTVCIFYFSVIGKHRTEPCGTPLKHSLYRDEDWPAPTYWDRRLRYEQIQEKAVPEMPKLVYNLLSNMLCSTMSQGRVATHLRCGDHFNYDFNNNLLRWKNFQNLSAFGTFTVRLSWNRFHSQ